MRITVAACAGLALPWLGLVSPANASAAGGGAGCSAGARAAFQASLVKQFNKTYGSGGGFWTGAPSDPTPYTLFNGSSIYERPGVAYIALRQILGPARFTAALRQLQRVWG